MYYSKIDTLFRWFY